MAKKKKSSIDVGSLTIGTILLLIVGFGIFTLVSSLMTDEGNDPAKEKQAEVVPKISESDYEGQPTLGDANAPVKIMEFGDYRCPSCKLFNDEVYPQLKKEYIDTGKVQFTFVNFQFMNDSFQAGEAGEAIFKQNPEAFWKYHHLMYANQENHPAGSWTHEFIIDFVKKEIPEVNVEQLSKDLKDGTYKAVVEKDNQLARKVPVESVPAAYVNGRFVNNSMDYEQLKKVIEEELAKK
ncbi:DsbA family protein [Hazenella coriacea]|uniref:Protein-disulfide isomerase n=1 Tax=Hazenella coriacea TaxID=1179467 RepID=A0A4R3LGQ5_9BACL|nr:DsbA family protein [Hazenella coriacea]TCS96696.1 protein-disulfide isomerase [Hazenella coriacea]